MEMEVEDSGGKEAAVSFYLSAFLTYIVQHVQAKDMIVHYDLYTPEQRKNIRLLMREKPNEAVRVAFDIIIYDIEDTDKYKHLLEMLEEAGYPKIVKMLTGVAIPRNANNKKLIQKFTPVILDGLKVCDVLPLLVSKGVLNNQDVEEIMATQATKGNVLAVLDLLIIFLANRRTSWYRRFIEVLLESNHRLLAEKIDKVLCNQIDAEKETDGGSLSSIESVDDLTASVQPVGPGMAQNPDPCTHAHTMMKKIHVTDPRNSPANIPMERVLYEIDAEKGSDGGSFSSIEFVDDETPSVQPVAEMAPNPDPGTHAHTMMKEIHVTDPRKSPVNIPMERVLYGMYEYLSNWLEPHVHDLY